MKRRFAEPPGGSQEFYVGYLSPAPAGISRLIQRAVLALALVAVGLAFALSALQSEFDSGYFDFGNVTEHTGILDLDPVPRLLPEDGSEPRLLVAFGKFGLDAEGLNSGQSVTVRATAIDAPAGHMLEVVQIDAAPSTPRSAVYGQAGEPTPVELVGEIVDSKCFLGVMKPGRGKTHRACASLCIRGGIPAGLFVDGDEPILYVLVGEGSEADGGLGLSLLHLVGQSVRVRGESFQSEGQWYLRTDRTRVTAL